MFSHFFWIVYTCQEIYHTMKRFSIFFLFLTVLLSSCVSNKDVISDSLIQKRKYRKGFFVQSTKTEDKKTKSNQETSKPADSQDLAETLDPEQLTDSAQDSVIEKNNKSIQDYEDQLTNTILAFVPQLNEKIQEMNRAKEEKQETEYVAQAESDFYVLPETTEFKETELTKSQGTQIMWDVFGYVGFGLACLSALLITLALIFWPYGFPAIAAAVAGLVFTIISKGKASGPAEDLRSIGFIVAVIMVPVTIVVTVLSAILFAASVV